MELGTTKRYCVSSTYSTNDSQHSSCRWDIWSHISECFQHLCRTIHHIEVYGTFDARHCKGFKNHCKSTVCCCCKSVALWSWQLAKGFKVGKSDSKDFSDREGCGCSLSSGIQQGLIWYLRIPGGPYWFFWASQKEYFACCAALVEL